jgi:hypothetical protein
MHALLQLSSTPGGLVLVRGSGARQRRKVLLGIAYGVYIATHQALVVEHRPSEWHHARDLALFDAANIAPMVLSPARLGGYATLFAAGGRCNQSVASTTSGGVSIATPTASVWPVVPARWHSCMISG